MKSQSIKDDPYDWSKDDPYDWSDAKLAAAVQHIGNMADSETTDKSKCFDAGVADLLHIAANRIFDKDNQPEHPNDCNHPGKAFAGRYIEIPEKGFDVYFYKNDTNEWSSCLRHGNEGNYSTMTIERHIRAVSTGRSPAHERHKAIVEMFIEFTNKNFEARK